MENGINTSKFHLHPRTRSFFHFGTQPLQQRLDVPPLDVSRHRIAEDGFEGFLVIGHGGSIVLQGTTLRHATERAAAGTSGCSPRCPQKSIYTSMESRNA